MPTGIGAGISGVFDLTLKGGSVPPAIPLFWNTQSALWNIIPDIWNFPPFGGMIGDELVEYL